MAHLQRRAVERAVRRLLRRHLDTQAAAAVQEVEGEPHQRLWQPWREAEQAVLQAHATEPRDERRPGPRQRSHVESVPRVLCYVMQIYERGLAQVVVGELELAHLGSKDGLRGCRQRGVAYSDRLVVCEVARLLLWRERIATQMHREDEVGLLDNLLAIEVKVREVQEQGVLVRRDVGEIPDLVFGKGFVLRGYPESHIIWDEHLLGCLAPAGCLSVLYAECAGLLGIAFHTLCRPAQVALGHEVGVDVVVGDGAVLIGSGDAVDAELVCDSVEIPE